MEYTDKKNPPKHALVYEFDYGENAYTDNDKGDNVEIPNTRFSYVVCYPLWVQDPEFHWMGEWQANTEKDIKEFFSEKEALAFASFFTVGEKDLSYEYCE